MTASYFKYFFPWFKTEEPVVNDPMLCDHANEVPMKCTCGNTCYCKAHTCKLNDIKQQVTDLTPKNPPRTWLGLESIVNTYSSVDRNGDQYMTSQDYREFLKMINKKAKNRKEY